MRIFIACILLLMACGKPVANYEITEKYADGKTKTEVANWLDSDGKKLKTGEKGYYENGRLKITSYTDENGQKTGMWEYWYDNGNLWSQCEYENGIRSGMSKVYYPDGTLRYEGNYKEDKQTGKWNFYTEKGEIFDSKEY